MKGQRTPRIALAIHALFGGGAERLMSQLANRWCENNEVHLITWAAADTDRYELSPLVVRHGLGLQSPSRGALHALSANIVRVQRLRKTLKTIAPDLLLSFSDQMNIVALEAARGLGGLPTWIAEHSDPAHQRLSRLWEAWRRRSYPTCSGCVALTPAIARYLEQWIPAERLRVIPPAISPPADAGKSADEPNWENSEQQQILFLGRLSREKQVDVLLEAWGVLQNDLPSWRLIIAGDGDQRQSLEQLAIQRRLERVQFVGWLPSPWAALSAAEIFVLPSRYEGFPVALLEAMSQGTACVVTRCSTAIDQLNEAGRSLHVVDHAANGHLSPQQLGTAIRQLANDPQLRNDMATSAIQTSQQFNWSHIGQLWDQLLD